MRILLLTQLFDPELQFKGIPFAKELIGKGHEIQVLTGFPNYPGGKVYKGYKIKLFQREVLDGIPVWRVPLYPSHDGNPFKRTLNYVSFALAACIIGPFGLKRPDLIYVYHPPATLGLPALFLSTLYRAPFVYDIQDLWPDTLASTGMVNSKLTMWLVKKWCQLIYSKATKLVVLSPGFKEILTNRGVPENKIEVIYNWCHESQLQDAMYDEELAKQTEMAGRFNVVFAGTMGKAQALDAVLDAARLLSNKLPKVQFVFIGGGIEVDRLKKLKESQKLENVRFLARRPMIEMGKIFGIADVLLVHLKDDPLFEITIPGKTQSYLASGRPILIGVEGEAAQLVTGAKAGLTCLPENSQDIANKVEQLFNMPSHALKKMGENGKEFYEKELSISIGAQKFEKLFREVRN